MIAWLLCKILHKHDIAYNRHLGYRCTRCGITLKEAREEFYNDIKKGDR